MNILFQLSGSIACYKACEVISRLLKAGHTVQTATTRNAEKFVGAATLEGLTGRRNLSDLWQTGDQMSHIRLPEWADAVVLCPASANTINKLAHGLADDLVSTLFQAHDFTKPYYVAPAMNPRMLSHPATEAGLKRLESWGVRILPTGEGRLACGDFGFGKLLEPEEIFKVITEAKPAPSTGVGLKILVTAGGTEEPIDSVRVLTNLSSGKTGAALADVFARHGADVTLLRSYRAAEPAWKSIRQRTFRTVDDLDALLREELATSPHDAVIHLAAVSDFRLASAKQAGHPADPSGLIKLDSDVPLELSLVPGPKLLPQLKAWATASPTPPVIVGFKLTDALDPDNAANPARAMIRSDAVDAVVHNARDAIDASGTEHRSHLYFSNRDPIETGTKGELAAALMEYLSGIREQARP